MYDQFIPIIFYSTFTLKYKYNYLLELLTKLITKICTCIKEITYGNFSRTRIFINVSVLRHFFQTYQ